MRYLADGSLRLRWGSTTRVIIFVAVHVMCAINWSSSNLGCMHAGTKVSSAGLSAGGALVFAVAVMSGCAGTSQSVAPNSQATTASPTGTTLPPVQSGTVMGPEPTVSAGTDRDDNGSNYANDGNNNWVCVEAVSNGYQASYYKKNGIDNVVDFNLYCQNYSHYFGDDGAFTAKSGNTYTYVFKVGHTWKPCETVLWSRRLVVPPVCSGFIFPNATKAINENWGCPPLGAVPPAAPNSPKGR